MKKNKVLIIRFSSFGDIVQCSTVVEGIGQKYPGAEIDWVTRSEFKELVALNKNVKRVYGLNRKLGIIGLMKLAMELRFNNYDMIYDAHNNLRSSIIYLLFRFTSLQLSWTTRSKDRLKRLLLFKFRKNVFPKPFKGINSYLNPIGINDSDFKEKVLVNYAFTEQVETKIASIINPNKKVLTFVPSAAWEMKRWPLEYWNQLAKLNSEYQIYILGGKEDTFCADIARVNPNLCTNLAGSLSLIESTCFIKSSDLVVSADTGLLHVADVLGVKAISLMGPTAFGFTTGPQIKTIEVDLACRPCTKDGRGKCSQQVYQKCMVDISPDRVWKEIINILK